MRLDLLERPAVATSPVWVRLGGYDLSRHEPASLALPGAVAIVALAVPGIRPADANVHWDVNKDPLDAGVAEFPEAADSLIGGFPRRHRDVPNNVLALPHGPACEPLGDVRGLFMNQIGSLHRAQAFDIRDHVAPGDLVLDLVGVDGQVMRPVDARIAFKDSGLAGTGQAARQDCPSLARYFASRTVEFRDDRVVHARAII